jgi:energy-coupling factor transporter transmembrane protein EcfT
LPFVLTPNPSATINLFFTLHISDFVLPGCFTLAIVSIIFYKTHNRYPAVLLVFLYSGGIVFHILYFLGIVESVIIVPNNIILAVGIPVDALSVVAIYDYYRRVH